jgi:hypothetical protein
MHFATFYVWKYLQQRRDELTKVPQTRRSRPQNDNGNVKAHDVLLEREILVRSYENIELLLGEFEQRTVDGLIIPPGARSSHHGPAGLEEDANRHTHRSEFSSGFCQHARLGFLEKRNHLLAAH